MRFMERRGTREGRGNNPESWDAMTHAFPPDGARPVGLTSDPQSLWILTSNPTQLIRYNFRYLER